MHIAALLVVVLTSLHLPHLACSQVSLPRGNWHRVPSDLALIDNHYGEQYLYLYSFCASFSSPLELITEESIYVQVLGLASSLQYVAFDWSTGAPGLDYLPPASSLHQPSIIVPLRTGYISQSGWNPTEESVREVSGLILSRWPLERVDLFFPQPINAIPYGECPVLSSLAHPCQPLEGTARVECAPEYPVGCDGYPSTSACPLSYEESYSRGEELEFSTHSVGTETAIHPWVALVGFVPVLVISFAVFILLRLDRLQRHHSVYLPDGSVAYVDELSVITHADDESDDESTLLPGDGLPV